MFEPFALKFTEEREAQLVVEALAEIRCDNAPDALRVKNMRRLLEEALGYSFNEG
jgi:hypothetical protein